MIESIDQIGPPLLKRDFPIGGKQRSVYTHCCRSRDGCFNLMRLDAVLMCIRENFIRIDPDIPDYKIEEILKKVELYDDIFSPGKNGLDTSLKKNAVTFSGGQRRRLSLAMIFACAAPIVILDEPFVGIDKRTQERLWVNIKEELRNKTVIIIEHNFSDTQYFQKVFVITGYGKVERTK